MRSFPRSQLRTNTQKSYFNYRLSRARMVVECSFGIMSAKFRILLKAIETKVENAVHIVTAITMLHNVIIDMEGYKHASTANTDDVPTVINIRRSRNNNHPSNAAVHIRNTFSQYFSAEK